MDEKYRHLGPLNTGIYFGISLVEENFPHVYVPFIAITDAYGDKICLTADAAFKNEDDAAHACYAIQDIIANSDIFTLAKDNTNEKKTTRKKTKPTATKLAAKRKKTAKSKKASSKQRSSTSRKRSSVQKPRRQTKN